jgi:hypothetical protein
LLGVYCHDCSVSGFSRAGIALVGFPSFKIANSPFVMENSGCIRCIATSPILNPYLSLYNYNNNSAPYYDNTGADKGDGISFFGASNCLFDSPRASGNTIGTQRGGLAFQTANGIPSINNTVINGVFTNNTYGVYFDSNQHVRNVFKGNLFNNNQLVGGKVVMIIYYYSYYYSYYYLL